MAGGFAGGISEVLSGKKKLSKRNKSRQRRKNKVKIDVNIIVEYGTRIPDIAFEIQNRVKTSVENMTGIKVEEVNVHVQGVNTNTVSKEETEQNEEEKRTSRIKRTSKKQNKESKRNMQILIAFEQKIALF